MRLFQCGLCALSIVGTWACAGSDPALFTPLDTGQADSGPRLVLGGRGDQLAPVLQDSTLVWFDLSADPNGACFSGNNPGADSPDDTCHGIIRGGDLESGRVWDLSDFLEQAARPVINDGQVAWRCLQDRRWGTCITPSWERDVSFVSDDARESWYRYNPWPYDARPAVHARGLIWLGHRYVSYVGSEWAFRVTEPHTKLESNLIALDQVPTEWSVYGDKLAWSANFWDGDKYVWRIQVLDLNTGNTRIITETEQGCFGLGGAHGVLAWKQTETNGTTGEESVQVFYRNQQGQIRKASGPGARVSAQGAVGVGQGLLVWLDYRQGDYHLAAHLVDGEGDELISDENAAISALMEPAISGRRVVWADRRENNWDLYLYSF